MRCSLANPQGIQIGPDGRPYIMTPRGPNYISPAAYGKPLDPSGTMHYSFLRGRPAWDQYKGEVYQPWNGGNILSAAVGAAMGAPYLASAFGGVAGGLGSAGYLGGQLGAVTGLAVPAATAAASAIAPTLAAVGSKAVPITLGGILKGSLPYLANTIGNIYSTNKQSSAAKQASDAQAEAAKYAADLQAKAAADALTFTKEQAARDQAQWAWGQNNMIDQWEGRERNLAPYRGVGLGATNTIASLLGITPVQMPMTRLTRADGGGGPAPDTSADQAYFYGLFPNEALSPADLVSKEAELNAKGWKVRRNAAGVAGKVELPNGRIIDVIQGAGAGTNRRQWLV